MVDPLTRQQLAEVSWAFERDRAEAARLHRLLVEMGGLVPLSAILERVLHKVDTLRRA